MSPSKQTLERALAAYDRHDGAGFASCFAEDGVLRVIALGEPNRGREQIQERVEETWRAFPDWTLEPRGLYAYGEEVVWHTWTISGTHEGEYLGIPATHRRFEVLGCSQITLTPEGLIAQDDVYFDSATVLRQLGVLPEPEVAQRA